MPLVITDPIIRQFAAEQRSSNRWAQSNIDNAVRVLHRVSRWLAARDVALLDATRADLAEYIADRRDNGRNHRGEPLSPNTLIVEHRQLKAYFAWAATDHGDGDPYITGNPMKNSKTPAGVDAEVSSTPSISEAQYRALLAACVAKRTAQGRPDGRSPTARRDVAILTLLWSTGARRGEIASIRYGDLDWGTQTVHLQKRGRRGKTITRDCYIDDAAVAALNRYIHERGDHPGALFETTRFIPGTNERTPIKADTITHMLRRRCTEAGLDAEDGGSLHDLETNHGWRHGSPMAAHYTREREVARAVAEAKRLAEARRAGRRLRAVN
jgi:integrase